MRILITGAKGFSGRHLTDLLATSPRHQVYLTDQRPTNQDNFIACNLADMKSVLALIETADPDQIYHLAGSFDNDYDVDYKANVLSLKHILDSLLTLGIQARVLLVGSAAEYGIVAPGENPVGENHPLEPVSIYGLTKLYQTCLMRYYCAVHKMDLVAARTFNLFGNGMSNRLFIGRLYEQIHKYTRGEISKVVVGNLQSKRDYIDVSDAVKYYELIMNHGKASEVYNVGRGSSIMIGDLLKKILNVFELGMDIIEVEAEPHAGKFDVADIYADIGKLKELESSLL